MKLTKNRFWKFRNQSEDEAELLLYGPISETTWWGDEVTPKKFAEDLKALGVKENIIVRINSGGGDVFAANAIYSLLKDNPANITVKVDGLAASAATIVAMAGDEIQIPANGMMMIHDPVVGLLGYYNTEDFEELTELLEKVKDTIVIAYMKKTGKERDELSKLMKDETWMTGEEAIEMGFADVLLDDKVDALLNGKILVVNDISHDISKFNTKPLIASNQKKPLALKFPDIQQSQKNKKDGEKKMEVKNVDDLKKAYPDLVNQIIDNARAEGVKEERERIKAIEEISQTIDPELAFKAKFEEPMDAKDLAFEALKADGKKGQEYLNNLKKDVQKSGVKEIEASSTDTGEEKPKNIFDKAKNIAAKFDAKRRGVKLND